MQYGLRIATLAALIPVVCLACFWASDCACTRFLDWRYEVAEHERLELRRSREAARQTAFDDIILPGEVDMRRLHDALVAAGRVDVASCEEIAALGHL